MNILKSAFLIAAVFAAGPAYALGRKPDAPPPRDSKDLPSLSQPGHPDERPRPSKLPDADTGGPMSDVGDNSGAGPGGVGLNEGGSAGPTGSDAPNDPGTGHGTHSPGD